MCTKNSYCMLNLFLEIEILIWKNCKHVLTMIDMKYRYVQLVKNFTGTNPANANLLINKFTIFECLSVNLVQL